MRIIKVGGIYVNKMGTWNSVPVTIKYLPFLSDITLEAENWIVLPIKIATLLALELKLEWNTSGTQGHLSLTWSLVRMWVSEVSDVSDVQIS